MCRGNIKMINDQKRLYFIKLKNYNKLSIIYTKALFLRTNITVEIK